MAHVPVEEIRMAAIRFGLIGMDRHGMRYAQHLMRDVEGVELYAVCRQDPLRGSAFYHSFLLAAIGPSVDNVRTTGL